MPEPLPRLNTADLPPAVDVSDNTAALAAVRAVVDAGPYTDEWDSLRRYRPPRWYVDAKFGIFIHWGVYSVPAFRNEWYSRTMYQEGRPEFEHHREVHGDQADFGYKDFIPSFTMSGFDPTDWARLFRRAGAQFVVPVAEHHDGFAMYDTARSRWSAARMGPERDVLGDLLAAVDEAWMVRGASTHRAEHWFFMNGGTRFDSDVRDPRWQDFYGPAQRDETAPNERFLEDWLLRCVEVVDRYRPQVLWFDWWIEQPAFEPYLRQLAAYYYNRAAQWGRGVVINHKWDAFPAGAAVYDVERGTLGSTREQVWQNDTSVSRTSWCWVDSHEYKSASDLVAELADVVAKNGVLLLNIGPKPDGTIAAQERALLEQVGDWLTRNGEAVYGTRPWRVSGEGPTKTAAGSFVDDVAAGYTGADVRFTHREDPAGEYVYAILLAEPEDGVARVKAFGTGSPLLEREVREVHVLGAGRAPEWSRGPDELVVRLPPRAAVAGGPVVKLFFEPEQVPERWDSLHGPSPA
ncbi:alpha-L-fucosidase [Kineococcus indalonis]|uniref:alpha-L-fucosidase n=1 Tax=Kineococcus indalonis TaxID=2696566 RepID=UPI001412A799|nr:alpha-L-fucosidase [Kineococcus indalonis]